MAARFFARWLLLALVGCGVLVAPRISVGATRGDCRASGLGVTAYEAGSATGTDYFAIALANTGRRTCRVGRTITMLTSAREGARVLASKELVPFDNQPPSEFLAPGQRGVVRISTVWAQEVPGDSDCPAGRARPSDTLGAIRLDTGVVVPIANPFRLPRCLRRVGPVTTDEWFAACVRRNVCRPLPRLKPPS